MLKKLTWPILMVLVFFLGMASDMALQALIHDYQFKSVHKWANMTPIEVESWIRNSLPKGSLDKKVISFLNVAQIEYHCEDETHSSNVLLAILSQVKGNSPFVNMSMAIKFNFENDQLIDYGFSQRFTGL